jgi:two-component sensor histidine kinase
MAGEGRETELTVRSDLAVVGSHEVVSLGLIVAELVINALKHGFPEGQQGLIVVDYSVRDDGWTLSVSDNGIGRGPPSLSRRVGLGTSVVNSLTRQLRAELILTDLTPGFMTSITHTRATEEAVEAGAATGVGALLG